MISVLTLTYKRPHLLEEAIESFLQQNRTDCEMVVINDNLEVDYVFEHPNVRIINHKERFSSISAKLEWGYKQCKYHWIYRLDDDDLLAEGGLNRVVKDILTHDGFEIYRSHGMYFFVNNKYERLNSNINNGNVYSKSFLDRITFPDKSIGEDADITFSNKASIYESKTDPTMCYRWGMNTFHISGLGENSSEVILAHADAVLSSKTGIIELHPQFLSNYYEQIKAATVDKLKNYIQLGANIGQDNFQQIIYESKDKLKVFLIEPNTDLIERLEKTYIDTGLIGKHEVIICPYGISLENGEQELYIYGDIDGNYSLLNRRTHPLKDISTSKKIKTKTFKDFCEDFNITEIEYLFIDIEGLDYEILNSIDLSKINIKTIIFEEWIHENDDRNNNYRSGPTFLEEVLKPKFKDYIWEDIMMGGMNNFKLIKH